MGEHNNTLPSTLKVLMGLVPDNLNLLAFSLLQISSKSVSQQTYFDLRISIREFPQHRVIWLMERDIRRCTSLNPLFTNIDFFQLQSCFAFKSSVYHLLLAICWLTDFLFMHWQFQILVKYRFPHVIQYNITCWTKKQSIIKSILFLLKINSVYFRGSAQ